VADVSKQQKRAEQILDAAADLVLRWGYKRVTIEEIAKRANIGKGTIYLHWKTREALFIAVIARDTVKLFDTMIEAIQKDPSEILLHCMIRRVFSMVQERPLLQAVFSRDTEVLGDLVRESAAQPLRGRKVAFSHEHFGLLRAHGLLRTDMDLDAQFYAANAAVFGFYVLDSLLPPEERVPFAERAEIAARTIRNAFEPPEPPDPDVMRALAPTIIEGLERLRAHYAQFAQGSAPVSRESSEE
jgi:AcrR family transcriptional regulator